VSIVLCALIFSETLALYKSFTYLLTYLLTYHAIYHTSAPVNHHVSIILCRSLQHIEVGTYPKEEEEEVNDSACSREALIASFVLTRMLRLAISQA